MAIAVADREAIFAERGFTWKVESFGANIASGGSYRLGFRTPSYEVVVLTRDYSSTVAAIFASLSEATHTGGTPARQLCLRLSKSGTPLFTINEGVTATPGATITSASIRAASGTGNANASLPGDLKPVIFKPDTDYVIDLKNDGANTGDIGLAFYFRPCNIILPTYNEAF